MTMKIPLAKLVSFFLMTLSAVLLVTEEASASAYCEGYARDAVRQFQEKQSLGCSGGLTEWWNGNADYHYKWCVTLPFGSALGPKGTADREAVLRVCRAAARGKTPPATNGIDCDGYARRAMAQTTAFSDRRCPDKVDPSWWSTDYGYHHKWCIALPAGSQLPAKGIVDRDRALARCGAHCSTSWAKAGISARRYSQAECEAHCRSMTSCTKARADSAEGCWFCLD